MTDRKSILHPDFKYRPSFDTNIRDTFARVRREQSSIYCGKRSDRECDGPCDMHCQLSYGEGC